VVLRRVGVFAVSIVAIRILMAFLAGVAIQIWRTFG